MDQLLNTQASSWRREGEFRYPGENGLLGFSLLVLSIV